MKGVVRLGKKEKLSPRYIGPFPISARVGEVAYRLALPSNLSHVHDVFHISILQKYIGDFTPVVDYSKIILHEDASYDLIPHVILDFSMKHLRNKVVKMVKIQWSDNEADVTWELEDDIRKKYPQLFFIL